MERPTYHSTLLALKGQLFSLWREDRQEEGLRCVEPKSAQGTGETIFHFVCREGLLPQIPQKIISRDLFLAKDIFDMTPLHWCSCSPEFSRMDLIPQTLLTEADFLNLDKMGWTPLTLALTNHLPLEKFPCKLSIKTLRETLLWAEKSLANKVQDIPNDLPGLLRKAIAKEELTGHIKKTIHPDL